jgi:hypothetical protein
MNPISNFFLFKQSPGVSTLGFLFRIILQLSTAVVNLISLSSDLLLADLKNVVYY